MILFMMIIYVAALFSLIKLKILRNTALTWSSTVVWFFLMLIFLFIPMQWGAPSGPVLVLTRAVQIVPNVSGQVINIPVTANTPLERGDLLFEINPEPFRIAVDLAEASFVRVQAQAAQDMDALDKAQAQLRQVEAAATLAQARYDDDATLAASGTISASRLEQRLAELNQANAGVDQAQSEVSRARAELGAVTKDGVVGKVAEAQARLDQTEWELKQTAVYAPGPGYVTNLAVSPGQRVTNMPFAPTMVFIDTSEKVVATQIHQIYLRHLRPGQPVELTFKARPGEIMTGTVETVSDVASGGQAMVTGSVAASRNILSEPFIVRIKPDDPEFARKLPAGAVGSAAIFTDSVTSTHFIRKVMIRMESILNYLKPAL